ncbi:MAG: lactate utilization protein [Deltaproteobacteria bacterium]|nr:lactate utilization protein [Deltaproteobacteria bacterium]
MIEENLNNQDRFLKTVKEAIKASPGGYRKNREELFSRLSQSTIESRLKKIQNRTRADQLKLLDLLMEQAEPINLRVMPVKNLQSASESIKELILDKNPEWGTVKKVAAWKHPLIDKLSLGDALAKYDIPVYQSELKSTDDLPAGKQMIREQIFESFVGITAADFCIAQTASLVMKSHPNQARAVSLVPSIHVAVIELNQIIENLGEFYFLQKWDPIQKKEGLTNCMTLISGPSKTGDIELIMVHGAHGPCELHLFVITGET